MASVCFDLIASPIGQCAMFNNPTGPKNNGDRTRPKTTSRITAFKAVQQAWVENDGCRRETAVNRPAAIPDIAFLPVSVFHLFTGCGHGALTPAGAHQYRPDG
jgi:hypothetical protein